jgi:hypothetical protein
MRPATFSDTLEFVLGALVDYVARVECGGGFKEKDPAFFFGDGFVLHATGDDDEFAGLDPFLMLAGVFVAVFHAESAFDDEEEFVLVVVMMPEKLRVGFDKLDHLSVEFSGDVRLVELRDLREFFRNVDFEHGSDSSIASLRNG